METGGLFCRILRNRNSRILIREGCSDIIDCTDIVFLECPLPPVKAFGEFPFISLVVPVCWMHGEICHVTDYQEYGENHEGLGVDGELHRGNVDMGGNEGIS